MQKRYLYLIVISLSVAVVVGSNIVARNLFANKSANESANNFDLDRRIIFYNGITDSYILTIEGRCLIKDWQNQFTVICKIGHDQYKTHFFGLSDNVTYFVEQLKTTDVSVYHHRVTFRPQQIIADIDFRGSATELIENASENHQ